MNNKNTEWVWSHRRKMSIHHLDIFVSGLINNGFNPALNYVQKNQLAIILPGNDTYLFDDENELQKLYNLILSQSQNKLFIQNLYKKNEELFGSLLLVSGDMRRSNLSLYGNEKIIELYNKFMDHITGAPLIRVQLTGIDACWSKNSLLKKELAKKAKDDDQYKEWVQIISHFQGESVAKTEQLDFLLLVNEFYKNDQIKNLLKSKKIKEVVKLLERPYKSLKEMLSNHMVKYEWVNSEYTGEKWEVDKWLVEISKFLDANPIDKIKLMEKEEKQKTLSKQKLIKKLNLSRDSLQIIETLDCFSAIRDWSKGYFVRALLDYRFLLTEISRRLKIEFDDLLYFGVDEVRTIFRKGSFNKKELGERKKNGAGLLMTSAEKKIYIKGRDIAKLKKIEAVEEIFAKKDEIKEFTGKTGYPGLVKGKVKIILQSKDISRVEKGDILVTYMTTMEFTPVFKKISALITDEGGISSHAAIISREFKIPCIIGSQVATRVLKDGDKVEINAGQGVVKLINN